MVSPVYRKHNHDSPTCFACIHVVFAVRATGEDEVKDAEYYPLKVGTTWEYKRDGKSYTTKITKHEKFNEVMCAYIETTVGGAYIAHAKDGLTNFIPLGDDEPPMANRFMKFPYKKGDTWNADDDKGNKDVRFTHAYVYGEETVEVPAGKYKTIFTKTNKFNMGGKDMQMTVWYAKGVGMVKNVTEIDGKKTETVLVRFTEGK